MRSVSESLWAIHCVEWHFLNSFPWKTKLNLSTCTTRSLWDLVCPVWCCGCTEFVFASVTYKQQDFVSLNALRPDGWITTQFKETEEHDWQKNSDSNAISLRKWEATSRTQRESSSGGKTMKGWRFSHKHLMRNDKQVVTGFYLTRNEVLFSLAIGMNAVVSSCFSDEQSDSQWGQNLRQLRGKHAAKPALQPKTS